MRLSAQFAVRLMEGAGLRIVTPGDKSRQPIRVNDRIAQLVIQRHCQADVRQYLLACQRLVVPGPPLPKSWPCSWSSDGSHSLNIEACPCRRASSGAEMAGLLSARQQWGLTGAMRRQPVIRRTGEGPRAACSAVVSRA
jgi:hypothetical protein